MSSVNKNISVLDKYFVQITWANLTEMNPVAPAGNKWIAEFQFFSFISIYILLHHILDLWRFLFWSFETFIFGKEITWNFMMELKYFGHSVTLSFDLWSVKDIESYLKCTWFSKMYNTYTYTYNMTLHFLPPVVSIVTKSPHLIFTL